MKNNKNTYKTKSQLIEELDTMYQRITELETEVEKLEAKLKSKPVVTRDPRIEIHTDIEFIADFDIVEAKGVNISKSGICFELSEDLPFEMRFQLEGEVHQHRAHLVWAKRLPEGGYRIGLRFVKSESDPLF